MRRRDHQQPVAGVVVVAVVMATMNPRHCRERLPLAESPESVEYSPQIQWVDYSESPSVDIDSRACHHRSGDDSRHSPRRPATRGLAHYYPRCPVA